MDLISKREAAEQIGLSTRGIERAVRRGHLAVEYRDSKHGKKAFFRPQDLEGFRQRQEAAGPVGFTSGIPGQPFPQIPPIGTVVPMVEIGPRRRKQDLRQGQNPVPIAERLTLTMNDAVQLSGLPRSFIAQNIRGGKLKALKIGRTWYVKRSELDAFVKNL
ncbi:MAG TPA: helix-turn-helix domain-containing protein [Terriglobales bacterium]|nr:helix-turn-helix domain-containing protein [Terriglobales bacterium]